MYSHWEMWPIRFIWKLKLWQYVIWWLLQPPYSSISLQSYLSHHSDLAENKLAQFTWLDTVQSSACQVRVCSMKLLGVAVPLFSGRPQCTGNLLWLDWIMPRDTIGYSALGWFSETGAFWVKPFLKKIPQIIVFLIITSDSGLVKPLRKYIFPPQAWNLIIIRHFFLTKSRFEFNPVTDDMDPVWIWLIK